MTRLLPASSPARTHSIFGHLGSKLGSFPGRGPGTLSPAGHTVTPAPVQSWGAQGSVPVPGGTADPGWSPGKARVPEAFVWATPASVLPEALASQRAARRAPEPAAETDPARGSASPSGALTTMHHHAPQAHPGARSAAPNARAAKGVPQRFGGSPLTPALPCLALLHRLPSQVQSGHAAPLKNGDISARFPVCPRPATVT
nr:PREDICTED: guanine nucleotide-binding protein G(s) subunit alpha isoforms XLas-like [Equus przewalskii]XP_008509855.1 PREDICTED: guanine nucleotide-binding protein G(s) subunit alpha isoforms XLas-like [Equus przewalskii]